MGKERAAARRLPPQGLAQGLGVHRQDHQVRLAPEVAAGGLRDLAGGGEVDEAVGQVRGRSEEGPRGQGRLPVATREDLVDAGQGAAPGSGPRNAQGGRWPATRGGS
jgi:hypothetical protein